MPRSLTGSIASTISPISLRISATCVTHHYEEMLSLIPSKYPTFDPTSASLRKSSTTSKPSLLEKSNWDESKPIASVFIWKQALTTIPLNQKHNTENSQSKIFGPIHRANATDISFIIYDIRPTNDRNIYLSNWAICSALRPGARLVFLSRHIQTYHFLSRAREHIKHINTDIYTCLPEQANIKSLLLKIILN